MASKYLMSLYAIRPNGEYIGPNKIFKTDESTSKKLVTNGFARLLSDTELANMKTKPDTDARSNRR